MSPVSAHRLMLWVEQEHIDGGVIEKCSLVLFPYELSVFGRFLTRSSSGERSFIV